MDDKTEILALYVWLMLMSLINHYTLQKRREMADFHAVTAPRQRYRPPIPYSRISRFSFVGLDEVLCYHLVRFSPEEIRRFLPLLGLETIRFRNRIQATSEEALAVILIKLSYPTRYWNMIDRFGHRRTWLSIVFNDTLIHLFRRYRKKLEWDADRITFESCQHMLWQSTTWVGGLASGVLLMEH